MDPIESLFSALTSDSAFTALLATHAGEPAIFTGDVIPMDCAALPYVWIRPAAPVGVNEDDFDYLRPIAECDVCLYAIAGQSSAAIDAAAWAAFEALHRQTLPAASGQAAPYCAVTTPGAAPTSGPHIAGRRLVARLYVKG